MSVRSSSSGPHEEPPHRIAVIGAGAAGLMAAIHAARNSAAEVHVLESTRDGGRKILISGGGRCNVLPQQLQPERFVTDSSPHALKRMLCAWPLEEQKRFFERNLEVPLIFESESRKYFPQSQSARCVRDALTHLATDSGVQFHFNSRVSDLHREGSRWHVRTTQGDSDYNTVIIATGGLSIPKTGSDGTGLSLLEALGHDMVPTYPALTPLITDCERHHALSGLSLDVELSVGTGRALRRSVGGFLFTHRGYSGPAVLDLSHRIVRDTITDLRDNTTALRVNWTREEPMVWDERLRATGRHSVRTVVRRHLPARLADLLITEARCEEDVLTTELRRDPRRTLVELLCAYPLPIDGHEGYKKAEVTGGGVRLSEVDLRTLESRHQPGLFLCGELLDAFGPIGGHNFAWAWSTGRSAGLGSVHRYEHAPI